MKVQVVLVLAVAACITVSSETVKAPYSIITDKLIPLGDSIRKAEERMQGRIVGGSPALLGEIPYQVGTLTEYIGISGTGVCGGSLVSPNRVVSAAHCWNDGIHRALRVTVVLESLTLFRGGTRIVSSVTALHPLFANLRYDIYVIYLPTSVIYSSTISPIRLPDNDELGLYYVGTRAVASGYGLTSEGGTINENASLYRADLTVLANNICSVFYPFVIQDSHLCTNGIGRVGICHGDSGSPLAVMAKGTPLLIGVASFTSSRGCEAEYPGGFTRIISVIEFLRRHVN